MPKGRSQNYPRYWCFTKGCYSVKVSKEKLEQDFLALVASLQPSDEYMRQLPEIAAGLWQGSRDRITKDMKGLNLREADLEKQRLNALKMRVSGELSAEELDVLKFDILNELTLIRAEKQHLESEKATLQELIEQSKAELIDFVGTWKSADIITQKEIQKGLFPEGVVYDQDKGYLNQKNSFLFEYFQRFMDTDPEFNSAKGLDWKTLVLNQDDPCISLEDCELQDSLGKNEAFVSFGVPDGI